VAIIKIPKKKTSSPNVKEKRKAGTRAGLTKAAIVAAAAKLIESVGANGFSLRKLAKALGVGPTTIHFHFEGGVGAVSSTVAQQALAGVTRPFKPKEEPAAYLAELLLKIMEALHARPVVAKLVVLQLSSNPILEPLLAERLLLALAALGVPTEARPKMYQRAMGVIFEMILAECGRSSAAEQKEASAQMHETIAALPSTEFPNLTELREAIVAETVQARSGEAVSSGRRRIRGPAHHNARRQVAARRRPNPANDGERRLVAASTLNRPLHYIVSAEWPGRCALWRLGFFEFLGDRKSHRTPGRRRVDSNRRRSQRPRPCDPRSPLTAARIAPHCGAASAPLRLGSRRSQTRCGYSLAVGVGALGKCGHM